MKLGARAWLAGLLACGLCACGTGRDFPDAGPFDASGPEPIALIPYIFDGSFRPATITQDFEGDFVSADATSGELHVLDHDDLHLLSLTPVASEGWTHPEVSIGRAGHAFLRAVIADGGSEVWSLDLGDDSASPFFGDAAGPGFHARRDDMGFVFARQFDDGGGAVVVVGDDGGVAAQYELAGVEDLASSGYGSLFASRSVDGGCAVTTGFGTDGIATELIGGTSPCMLGLSHDSLALWLAASDGDAGAEVFQLDAASLSPLAHWSIPGFSPAAHSAILSDDGAVAILGADTVAVGRAIWLAQGGGFQTASEGQLPGTTDAVFDANDDHDHLYIAAPADHAVYEIP